MNANEKLVDYILSLTDEQVEKLINHLPELISLLEGVKSDANSTTGLIIKGCD